MSYQLLFIDFLASFCQFLDPFVNFSKLKIIQYGLGVFFGLSREVFFGYLETFWSFGSL
jgi:uncharacterized membrane protein required for colicin V production